MQYELSKPQPGVDFPSYQFGSDLNFGTLNHERISKMQLYLAQFKKHMNKEFMKVSKERDKMIYQIEKTLPEGEHFNTLKERYFNQSVTDMVRLNNKLNKVIVYDEKLIPIIDPVFRDAKGLRSHFYASTKRLGNMKIETFWYNIGIIWLMSLIMMVTLYFDLFKRMIQLFDTKRI